MDDAPPIEDPIVVELIVGGDDRKRKPWSMRKNRHPSVHVHIASHHLLLREQLLELLNAVDHPSAVVKAPKLDSSPPHFRCSFFLNVKARIYTRGMRLCQLRWLHFESPQ